MVYFTCCASVGSTASIRAAININFFISVINFNFGCKVKAFFPSLQAFSFSIVCALFAIVCTHDFRILYNAWPKAEKATVDSRVWTLTFVNSVIPFNVTMPAMDAASKMAMTVRTTRSL